MTDIKHGDIVRIVIEGPWHEWDTTTDIIAGYGEFEALSDDKVTVEKVEPPVITFGPGDLLRHKGTDRVRALGDTGYIILNNGIVYTYGQGSGHQRDYFTSKSFEKITLP